MNFLQILIKLEENPDMHIARILILLKEFAGREGEGRVSGLTKLAKLDFLLRYPVYLGRALESKGISSDIVRIEDYEIKSVESSMIRYRYGPWDPRYRLFLNLLTAKDLTSVNVSNRTIMIGLTPAGIEKALRLSEDDNFKDVVYRARLLKKYFDMSGTRLKDFIYETFPEIVSLKLGEGIRYEDEVHKSDTPM